jgi:CRISPR-associated protein Csm3
MNDKYPRDQRNEPVPGKLLIGYTKCTFRIRAEEGVAVHGGEADLQIGSAVQDNLRVIKNPTTGYPYLPGSSLKGKLRSTLEKILPGKYDANKGEPCDCGREDCMVCVIFGAANPGKRSTKSAPTRIVVRDAQLTDDARQKWQQLELEGKPTLELKTESSSNRATGAAVNPRTGERVPPQTEFQGEIILREFDNDPHAKYIEAIQKVMKFIADSDGVGSGISRGSGRVSFQDFDCEAHKAPTFS